MGASERVNPGAWKRDSFAGVADYAVDLTGRDRGEILAALAALQGDGRLAPAHALARADFPFGALGERLRGAYADVRSGRGFVLLRGLPVEGLTVDAFIAAVWGVGSWFGSPLSQNAQGELSDTSSTRPPRTRRRACTGATSSCGSTPTGRP